MLTVWHVDIGRPSLGVDGIAAAVHTYSTALAEVGCTTRRFGSVTGGLLGALREGRRIGRLARAERPDVVHLHSAYRPAHALLAALLVRSAIPFVVSPHSGLAVESRRRDRIRKGLWIAGVERALLHAAACVAVLSDAERADVLAVAPRAVCRRIPNAVPVPERAAAARQLGPGVRPRLVCLSRYDVHQKGLDRLAVLAGQLPEVDVVVHGAPDHNQPRSLAQLRAVAPANFALAESVQGAAKEQALVDADVYVQLSRWEGLSVALLEAMAVGVPCLVSEEIVPTLGPELVAAVTVAPEDPDEAADVVRHLLCDLDARRSMGRRGRAVVAASFRAADVAEGLLLAYGDSPAVAARR